MLQENGYTVVTPTDVMTMDLANREFVGESCIITNQVTQEWLEAFFALKKYEDQEVCKTATQIMNLIQDKTMYCRMEQDGVMCCLCLSSDRKRLYVPC